MSQYLRAVSTLSGEVTLLFLYQASLLKGESALKGQNLLLLEQTFLKTDSRSKFFPLRADPFCKGFLGQENKQEVQKSFFPGNDLYISIMLTVRSCIHCVIYVFINYI